MVPASHSDRVREHARKRYVEQAKKRNESTVRIVAGDVQKAVHLSNRVPLVCQALKSRQFLEENGLVLEKWEGPPSGISTTVVFTYRFKKSPLHQESGRGATSPFLHLRGIAKDVFSSLGGGEAFLRNEREKFYEFPGGSGGQS
jgi:hypothetical protein